MGTKVIFFIMINFILRRCISKVGMLEIYKNYTCLRFENIQFYQYDFKQWLIDPNWLYADPDPQIWWLRIQANKITKFISIHLWSR